MKHIISICLLMLIGGFIVAGSAQAAVSIDVPIGHWSYEVLDRLACSGLIDRFGLNAKPLTRVQVAYLLKEAIATINSDKPLPPVITAERSYAEEQLLYKLVEEFRPELVRVGVELLRRHEDDGAQSTFKFDFLRGEFIFAGLETSSSSLIENSRGWRVKDGINSRKVAHAYGRVHDIVAVSLMPGVRISEEDIDTDLETGYANVSFFNLIMQAGRKNLWWGPGYHGALLISNNTFALDMLRIKNQRPIELPWKFNVLGRYNFDGFVAQMEADRQIPNALLGGLRLEWSPVKIMEFGLSHTFMFGGDGETIPSIVDLLDLSKAGGGEETVNHIVSCDMQLNASKIVRWLRLAGGCMVYGEVGAEDEQNMRPVYMGYLFGVFVPDVFNVQGLNVRAEFAQNNINWYRHFKYQSGYRYKNEIIGHHMGADARDLFLEVSRTFDDGFKGVASFDFEQNGRTQAFMQERIQVELGLIMQASENVQCRTVYRGERYTNLDHISGNNETHHMFIFEFSKKF